MPKGGIRVSLVREGVKLRELNRILKKHGSPTEMRVGVQRVNKKILKPVANALRIKALRQNTHPKRQSREFSLAKNIRVVESKRDKLGTAVIVTAFHGQFLQSGTKVRPGRGRISGNKWATEVYDRWEPKVRNRMRKDYIRLFTISITKDISMTRSRERIL